MKEYNDALSILDELEDISSKVAFMAAVSEAMARMDDGGCISENAMCGMYKIYSDIESNCQDVAKALRRDYIIFKNSTAAKSPLSDEKTVADRTAEFCAAVEKHISRSL
jgi:hypothetical protein